MALKLHHLNASRSQRLVWLIEELGAPVEIVSHQRHPETRLAPPALLDIHPMGKSPLLEYEGGVIAETGAIAEYLLARFDGDHKLHPRSDSPDYPRYLEWLHSAEGAPFLPGLMMFYLANVNLTDSPLSQAMAGEAAKAAAHIERHLSDHAYFAGGAFSAADCLMGFQIQNAVASGAADNAPATKAWLERVQARPAYQRMLAIGI
ncbi:MAG: glutathione S-transferase family protein [Pseudomonadota bacterium]